MSNDDPRLPICRTCGKPFIEHPHRTRCSKCIDRDFDSYQAPRGKPQGAAEGDNK